MYKELDEYLSGYFTIDYWYDEGVIIAEEILQKFDENDWNELLENILLKSVEWQTRFAYSIDKDINNEKAIESLVMLSQTDNDELLITVVDSLRCVIDLEKESIIEKNSSLVDKIEEMIPRCGVASRKLLEDFVSRVRN